MVLFFQTKMMSTSMTNSYQVIHILKKYNYNYNKINSLKIFSFYFVLIVGSLQICVSFAEVRNSIDHPEIIQNSAESDDKEGLPKIASSLTPSKNKIDEEGPLSFSYSNDLFGNESIGNTGKELGSSSPDSQTRRNSRLRVNLCLGEKKRWSFPLFRRKREPLIEKINAENDVVENKVANFDNSNARQEDESSISGDFWEVKELVSRDGQAKLNANVFFASFDQRSEKADGQSACATLATVIVHWLQSNQDFVLMPSASQFDSLIAEGSSKWRKLCNDQSYMNSFPDNHFDLETVLKADLRPLTILGNKSFTGIFSPEKFENLKGAKSFDDIWKEISSSTEDYDQRIYIVSWNDHFFVLKANADAFYIIDSLGERLFEGCNQAYILKFDESSVMHGKVVKEEDDSNEMTATEKPKDDEEERAEIICKGKECCREFIKRFLAAIPLKELEEEEKKGKVSTFSLLQRLQIDFHYCSSSTSSSLASPTSSHFSSDGCIT
ncbi:hypothetical protein P3X46_019338 [Hevea brasiliensis]|uniref:Uncharacterized protein n=1 Tax=Hevea brasiliensis TaxID=3981 RepID=A0ABQ9LID3_HEVBR|nr:hypothetical protein P3X46_019338 [Hevea brasiliensis]